MAENSTALQLDNRKTAAKPASRFRADIEGLRCIAVLAVLAFHLDPHWLPGGFQGVDIFFVISGYLITRLIRDQGTEFSFRRFYLRRFWRLFPALAFTIAATLIASYKILSPYDYKVLATSALTAISGISNFFFYGTLDYFNDNTLVHPLLHTWSLGIEEQFYLFWPLLIVVAGARFPLSKLIGYVLAGTLAFNLLLVDADPQFAFYMMPFRIFEFATGAAILFAEPRLPAAGRLAAGIIGALLIGVGLVMFDENRVWPGAAALFPAAGTALLLYAGSSRTGTALLGNPLFCLIGRISYVLYLVHWPIIVLYRYWRVVPLSLNELAGLALMCVGVAYALHVAIEIPFREGRATVTYVPEFLDIRRITFWQKAKAPLLGLGTLATVAIAIAVWGSGGLPERINKNRAQRSADQPSYAGDICSRGRCLLGDPTSERLVYVVGDSYAGNLFYGLDALFRELGVKGIGVLDHGCLFLFNTTRFIKGTYDKKCARNIADTFAVMGADRAPVILAGNHDGYIGSIGLASDKAPIPFSNGSFYPFFRDRMIEGLQRLDANHRPVLMVKSSYDSGVNIARCLSRPGIDKASLLNGKCKPKSLARNRETSSRADAVLDEVAQRFARASTIDPKLAFCDSTSCTVMKDGIFLMRDTSHLTNEGSLYMVERLRAKLLAWLGNENGA